MSEKEKKTFNGISDLKLERLSSSSTVAVQPSSLITDTEDLQNLDLSDLNQQPFKMVSKVSEIRHSGENNEMESKKNSLNRKNDTSFRLSTSNNISSPRCHKSKSVFKKAGLFTVMMVLCLGSAIVVSFGFNNSKHVAQNEQFVIFKVDIKGLTNNSATELNCPHKPNTICIPFLDERSSFIALESNRKFKATVPGIFEISLSITLHMDNVRVCIEHLRKNTEICSKARMYNNTSLGTLNVLDIRNLSANDEFIVKISGNDSVVKEDSLTRLIIKHYRT